MPLVTVEELRDFLGVDEDSDSIIRAERNNALDELYRATGYDWTMEDKANVANEAVRVMVYISYYGVRGGLKNLDFLERRKTQLTKMLQFSGEASCDGE